MKTIVVGIDGSDESKAALQFAVEEARTQGAKVRAVAAWHVPPVVYAAAWAPAEDVGKDFEDDARRALEEVVAGAQAADVEVETAVQEGQPARVLLEEAEQADLLVLGSRGLGGFRGLLLGSVSQQCAQHSPCPITILPRRTEDSATPTAD